MTNYYLSTDKIIAIGTLIFFMPLIYVQTHMKGTPQIILITYGILTIFTLIKFNRLGSVLFISLLGLALFILGYILTNLLLDILISNRGWAVDKNGVRQGRVMDFSVFLGIPIGIIFAWLSLRLYNKKVKRKASIETACATLYTLATIITYFVNEIR